MWAMNNSANITDAEWLIMRVLWEEETATASHITATLSREREVSPQTVKTLIRRLVDKGLVAYTVDAEDSRVYHYRPTIGKDEAVRRKSEAFVHQVYQSDVGGFLAHFVENGGLSKSELERLRQLVAKRLDEKP